MILTPLINQPFVHTIVLFRNPKCASSTLYRACSTRNLFCREKKLLEERLGKEKKYGGVFDVSHITPLESYRLFGRGILNLFSVCCVRNPFDRAVSSFSFSRGKGWGKLYGLPDDGTFSDFCEAIYKLRKDPNFWPALPQVVYSNSVVPIKCLLKFETLQSDWSVMIKEYNIQGLPLELPWENRTEHEPWQEFYGPTEKRIIQEVFEEDFRKHQYPVNF